MQYLPLRPRLLPARLPLAALQASRAPAAAITLAAALVLAGCGGAEAPETEAQPQEARQRALAAFPSVPIPADAHQRGMWGPLYNWPLVAVHAALLPDGRVLSYGSRNDGSQTANFEFDIWDNVDTPGNGHTSFINNSGTDIFCSSQLLLPPTSPTSPVNLFIAGGDVWNGRSTINSGNNNSNLINPGSGSITRGANMNRARWYSTSITLINGETFIMGGAGGTDRPEVRASNGSFRVLSSADTGSRDFFYPRNFVMPDGRVFGYDSRGAMYRIDTAGAGGITGLGNFSAQYASADASAAMFRPGRILQFGGNANGALVIDMTSGTPVVTPTQVMSVQRRLASATVLADGRVLATGGSTNWNDPATAHNTVEVWNPQTGQWTTGPAAARPRLYHSNALLLPDGSVLVTGGGSLLPNQPTVNQLNAQIYYPSYLFTSGSQRAARPAITSAPGWLDIGRTFTLQTATAGVARVVLVKTGSATHNWNMEQRFIELAFNGSGTTLNVQAPARAGEAPPGFYMLFVLDAAGVPSVAHMLRIGVAANPNPALVPVLSNPGNRSAVAGTPLTLQLSATDPNGDPLRYAASGLPPGLSLNATSGLISGTPSTPGSYNVVFSASDGINAASASAVWTVSAANGLVLNTAPQPQAAAINQDLVFRAAASGSGVQYQWNFGDGRPDTAWSSSGSVSTRFASPGTFIVTLRVRDGLGDLISRSFLQSISLPATANRPTQSGLMALEQPATGNARLWVVNPDQDSVSVLDAVTGARLAEIAVGAAPRSIARAANGVMWVSNRDAATLSLIDPVTRSVTRTLTLPRASQPEGIAMSPSAPQAFVALAATGQLLRLDTSTLAQTGALPLGTHIRQVAVAADGNTVLVSRFITPPLPGEGTASVSTPATAGAQVLHVNASTMALQRTVILQHSERADGEGQGRGIPNYLGAVSISPDGSQAYVPSKLDNVKRGGLRDGQPLNFQNTVRAVSSRLILGGSVPATDDLARRVDHDNASMASAAAFDARGSLLFVALETSREVAVVDAHSGQQRMRFDTGRAPQGLLLSANGRVLYVHNFMDRSVTAHDLTPLLDQGVLNVPLLRTMGTVAVERLSAPVLLGKQLFYDARDTRLARERYMSCASCHNDGGHDGRTWDLTHLGEGLRNTPSLRGRAGAQGRLHWSANFDEVQDFEGQIRQLAGGTGLMSDAQFNAGTRSQPLGDRKAGLSANLDALAAYVSSLSVADASPWRQADGSLTAQASAGKTVFQANCLACHGTGSFTTSAASGALPDIGTLKPSSGGRLGAALTGIDPPTLRDAWNTAPYLHDGSAATLAAAVSAHGNLSLSATQLAQVTAYVQQIGREEGDPVPTVSTSYEAESGSWGNGAAVQTAASASGGRVVGAINNAGAFSQVSVNGPASAGNATLVIRYANGYADNRSLSLYVNGVRRQQLVFAPSGGWNSFVELASLTVPLNAGSNTIRLQRDAGDLAAADIDRYTVTVSGTPPANRPPSIAAPASQSGRVGTAASLAMAASDPDGDALTFSASGLPAGLSIHAGTGLISGTPTATCSCTVFVSVQDGRGGSATTTPFAWTVLAALPPTPWTAIREAESGPYGRGAQWQWAAEASGGWVIGALNGTGAFTEVTVAEVPSAGNANLVIRYANGHASTRSLSLYVNGVRRQSVSFAPTGGWTRFANSATLVVPLNAGDNTVRLQRDASDIAAADIDRFSFSR